MILTTRNGRKVEVTDIDYSSGDSCDTFIAAASYLDEENDTLAVVPDNVLEELTNDCASELDEAWHEHQIGRADFYSED